LEWLLLSWTSGLEAVLVCQFEITLQLDIGDLPYHQVIKVL
jgi:hypothetical protein